MVSEQFVREQFSCWETDNPMPFFDSLPEQFSWQVVGAINPLRGTYTTKEQCLETFNRLISKFEAPPVFKIINIIVAGDKAVVEVSSTETSKAGKSYDQLRCFVNRYENDKLVEIRMYVDTAVEKEAFESS
jgi:uncharacterized protein